MAGRQGKKAPMDAEPVAVTLLVVDALEALQAPYVIVGSLASAVHGVARATLDADLVADLRAEHVEPLARALSQAFYIDIDTIQEAVRRRGSFNVIHLETAFKVDVFVCRDRPYDREQLRRATPQVVCEKPERRAYLATAEDTVLSKLQWYRLGGGVSERQWGDVLGVLKVQRGRLDRAYLRKWAVELDVADLLERGLAEAGIG
jgi:hypothetical protein